MHDDSSRGELKVSCAYRLTWPVPAHAQKAARAQAPILNETDSQALKRTQAGVGKHLLDELVLLSPRGVVNRVLLVSLPCKRWPHVPLHSKGRNTNK